MSLSDQINTDIKEAMKAKDKDRLNALRAVKSALLLAATEKGNEGGVSDDVAMKALQKLLKQRQDSAQLYAEQGRADLADEELVQAKILQEYMPEAVSDEELEAEIKRIVADTGAQGMRDMGKVMGIASKKFAGRADGKAIADKVKSLLG